MSKDSRYNNIYTKVLLSDKISLDFKNINSNVYNVLEKKLKNKEGFCCNEGYIKHDSIKLISYSAGELYSNYVSFDTVYECLVTNPVESMTFDCIVKSITKVGIRAELPEHISPFVIFIARDHHYNNELFSQIKIDDIINIKVIGQRYELNDRFISIIAELNNINKLQITKNELSNPEKMSEKKSKKNFSSSAKPNKSKLKIEE